MLHRNTLHINISASCGDSVNGNWYYAISVDTISMFIIYITKIGYFDGQIF